MEVKTYSQGVPPLSEKARAMFETSSGPQTIIITNNANGETTTILSGIAQGRVFAATTDEIGYKLPELNVGSDSSGDGVLNVYERTNAADRKDQTFTVSGEEAFIQIGAGQGSRRIPLPDRLADAVKTEILERKAAIFQAMNDNCKGL